MVLKLFSSTTSVNSYQVSLFSKVLLQVTVNVLVSSGSIDGSTFRASISFPPSKTTVISPDVIVTLWAVSEPEKPDVKKAYDIPSTKTDAVKITIISNTLFNIYTTFNINTYYIYLIYNYIRSFTIIIDLNLLK